MHVGFALRVEELKYRN